VSGIAEETKIIKNIKIATVALLLTGCNPAVFIQPPLSDINVTELCIINNPKVIRSGFLPELRSQIGSYGIKTQLWTSYNPEGCRYWLEYTANWGWGALGSYMNYADIKLYEKKTLIGTATYESDQSDSMQYASADEKLRLLTKGLFAKHQIKNYDKPSPKELQDGSRYVPRGVVE